jgi:hypothetical protein
VINDPPRLLLNAMNDGVRNSLNRVGANALQVDAQHIQIPRRLADKALEPVGCAARPEEPSQVGHLFAHDVDLLGSEIRVGLIGGGLVDDDERDERATARILLLALAVHEALRVATHFAHHVGDVEALRICMEGKFN